MNMCTTGGDRMHPSWRDRNPSPRRWYFLVSLGVLALIWASPARGEVSPTQGNRPMLANSPATLTASPTSGAPGTAVSTSGAHFGHREQIVVYWDPPLAGEQPLPSVPALIQTDATGAFTATVTIPMTATMGLHTLTAVGQTSGLSASDNFVVISVPVPTPIALRFVGRLRIDGMAYLTNWERSTYVTLVVKLYGQVSGYYATLSPGQCGSSGTAIQAFGALNKANQRGLGIAAIAFSNPQQDSRWHVQLFKGVRLQLPVAAVACANLSAPLPGA
jgi:hypothetical protein